VQVQATKAQKLKMSTNQNKFLFKANPGKSDLKKQFRPKLISELKWQQLIGRTSECFKDSFNTSKEG